MHCFSLTHWKQHYDRFLFYMVHTCYWFWFTEWFIIIMCYYSIIMVTMLLFQVCTPTQTTVLLNGLTVQQTKHLLVQTTITNFYHITLSVKLFQLFQFSLIFLLLLILTRLLCFSSLYETNIYTLSSSIS